MKTAQTYPISLPHGYQDEEGKLHRNGVMRQATPGDEVRAMMDARSLREEGYGRLLLLTSVIERLGDLEDVSVQVIEALGKEDLDYLIEQYRIINEAC